MKLFNLRQIAHRQRLLIEEIQAEGFLVKNDSSKHPMSVKCGTLEEVEEFLKEMRPSSSYNLTQI